MNLEVALRAHLRTVPALAALVGTRIYPRRLPQSVTLPAITIQRISTGVVQHKGNSHLDRVRVQVDGWADDYAGAEALQKEIRAGMETFKRQSNPRVARTFLRNARDLDNPDINRYRASMDFMIWVNES